MKRIYIAGPLFSEAELEFNEKLDRFLKNIGYETFLPQNDGHELSELLKNGEDQEKANKKIFERDTHEIKKSDILILIMDGRVPDEGACVEIGYAYALGKECVGVKTDVRSLIGNNDNPMITGALKYRIASNFKELEDILDGLGGA